MMYSSYKLEHVLKDYYFRMHQVLNNAELSHVLPAEEKSQNFSFLSFPKLISNTFQIPKGESIECIEIFLIEEGSSIGENTSGPVTRISLC